MGGAIRPLSTLALVSWPFLCSAQQGEEPQQSSSVVATLQLPSYILNATPYPTAFNASLATSTDRSEQLVLAYTISCQDLNYCHSSKGVSGQYLEFTAITGSTTYDLSTDGIIVCGVTDNGPTFSGTALCTATAGPGEYYYTTGVSEATWTESGSYAIYFSAMDEDLASFIGATTTTYSSSSTTESSAATSTVSPIPIAPTTAAPSTSATASTSTSNPAPFTPPSSSKAAVPTAPQAQVTPTESPTGSNGLTEHEKIGVGVGIAAFVLVCCAAGLVISSYRKKRSPRRAANPNPSELYFNTDEKGQASGT